MMKKIWNRKIYMMYEFENSSHNISETQIIHDFLCWANYLPAHIKSVTTNYSNDQLQFSLLKMGQVEILGRDRKRSVKRKKGAK